MKPHKSAPQWIIETVLLDTLSDVHNLVLRRSAVPPRRGAVWGNALTPSISVAAVTGGWVSRWGTLGAEAAGFTSTPAQCEPLWFARGWDRSETHPYGFMWTLHTCTELAWSLLELRRCLYFGMLMIQRECVCVCVWTCKWVIMVIIMADWWQREITTVLMTAMMNVLQWCWW